MTSLLISYPDLPFRALYYSATQVFDQDYPLENMFAGERGAWSRLQTATSGSVAIIWDLGSSGAAATFDHMIVGGVSELLGGGCIGCALAGSPDNVTYTNHLGTAAGFATRTFAGPNSRDVLFTRFATNINNDIGPAAGTYRYWRVSIYGGTQKFPLSKLHIGNFLDLGKEPDFYEWSVVDTDETPWQYPRGHQSMGRLTHEIRRVTLEYDGLSDALVNSITANLLRDPYRRTVFLHAVTYTEVLFGNSLLHCRVVADECSIERTTKANWNNVKLVFEEMV